MFVGDVSGRAHQSYEECASEAAVIHTMHCPVESVPLVLARWSVVLAAGAGCVWSWFAPRAVAVAVAVDAGHAGPGPLLLEAARSFATGAALTSRSRSTQNEASRLDALDGAGARAPRPQHHIDFRNRRPCSATNMAFSVFHAGPLRRLFGAFQIEHCLLSFACLLRLLEGLLSMYCSMGWSNL